MPAGTLKPLNGIPEHSRILIVKPSSLGDIIHTIPVVHALKRCAPTATIAWIVQKPFKSLLERDPAIDELYSVDIPSTSDPAANKWSYLHAFSASLKTLCNLRQSFHQKPYN